MRGREFKLVGRGIYSVNEAARLTQIPARKVRRWLLGYEYPYNGEIAVSPPVIETELSPIDDEVVVSFLDLIELRFVDAFRHSGVSLHAIRLASKRASELLGADHPFATQRFRTDGRTILAELAEESEEPELLDLVKNQMAFKKILAPYLYRGLEFSADDIVARWWPMQRSRRVVVDPDRAFGQPVVAMEGVPTAVLADAFSVDQDADLVADVYEVDPRSVLDAVEFEDRLAA